MKKYIFSFFIMLFLAFGACLTYSASQGDEAIIFGGYCYYVENGDIYRAPITALTGETELFRKDSISISLEGSDLISLTSDGNIAIYSLICEDELLFEGLEFKSAETEDDGLLLGSLSAKYESNGNPAAISKGNDAGGVSFGAYQFASNAGVPKAFADWCISSGASNEIGSRLLAAYKSDGSACGENFKAEWLAIAKEDPDLFLSVQHRYVKEKYYDAIVARIEKNVPGFDMDIYGIALRNVFWSRSVQHGVGGSYNVITRAFDALGGFCMQSEEALIRAIYAESGAVVDSGTNPMTGATAESLGIAGKYMKYYSKNSSAVQISVYKRLNINELALALDMLEKYGGYEPPIGVEYGFTDFIADEISENSAKISATIKNYKLNTITEYGFFMGKNMNSLLDIPLFVGETTASSITLSKKITDSLESGTTYYYGAYAFIGGEYVTSDIFTFETLNDVKFKVTYLDYDGTLLYETTVKKGENATYDGVVPSRSSNAQCSFVFGGWDNDGKNISFDTVINALYIQKDHLWDGEISNAFASGNGTSLSPYIISSPEDLAHLSLIVNSGFETDGIFFELSNNIVLGYGSAPKDFTPIGTEGTPFKGTFIGNGYKIIGLTVSDVKNAGLFGVICGANIDSLIIENANIYGEFSGILSGMILKDSQSIISNCSFSGTVRGKDFAGGVVGYCYGNSSFFDIFFSGEVTADVSGGLFGHIDNSLVCRTFCSSVTNGQKNDSICASFSENTEFLSCYYSNSDVSAIGNALSGELMTKETSYDGFDFSTSWTLNEKHAVLKISDQNNFEYFKYGDTNGDGDINVIDSVFLAQYLAAWKIELPRNFEKISDVSGDGKINIADAVMLVQYLAKWDISLMKKM